MWRNETFLSDYRDTQVDRKGCGSDNYILSTGLMESWLTVKEWKTYKNVVQRRHWKPTGTTNREVMTMSRNIKKKDTVPTEKEKHFHGAV